MGLMLNLVYVAALIAAWPWIVWRRVRKGKRFGSWREKLLGELPRGAFERRCVWIHAVSVGEVLQIQPLLDSLSRRFPEREFLISSTTTTGYDVACAKFGDQHRVCYFPLDFTWSVRRALSRVAPEAIILVELELWPNFITLARQRGIPICVINGRMTERSFRRYQFVRPLMRALLSKLSIITTQTEQYAARFRALGARIEQVHITGSIKFDGVRTDRDHPRIRELRQAFSLLPDETLWIAGSTQAPEEECVLNTYRELQQEFPKLRLMLVPRHQERFEEVAELIQSQGYSPLRRSRPAPAQPLTNSPARTNTICLLDTLGELGFAWGLADIAFVGGSLTPRGGQNMIEPAGYGVCLLFGPNTWNFQETVQLLLDGEAAQVVPDSNALTDSVRHWLAHPEAARALGHRARTLVLREQGATQRTLEFISPYLTRTPHTRIRAA